MDEVEILFAMFGGFAFVIFLVTIALYVLQSLGLMKIAEKLDVENAWLAWIPLANLYVIGKSVGDTITIFGQTITNLGVVLLAGGIGVIFLSAIPLIGFLITLAFVIIVFESYYEIYKMFKPESAKLYLVLSIVIPVSLPVILFLLSKNEPIR